MQSVKNQMENAQGISKGRVIFTNEDLKATINGACFLGSGGGGGLGMATLLYNELSQFQSNFPVVRLEDVEDDAEVCIVAGIGSPRLAVNQSFLRAIQCAFEELERYLQVNFAYTIAAETGGFNSIAPFTMAVARGLPVIDADGAGRSIPQIDMLPYGVEQLKRDGVLTAVIANELGAKQVVQGRDLSELDENLRQAITGDREHFNECAGLAFCAMTGKEVKAQAIPGTLSLACQLGKLIEQGATGFWEQIEGLKLLASGTIVEIKEETRGGFDFGQIRVRGDEGEEYLVQYKNENLMIWRDEEVLAMAPDLICCATKDGKPRSNVEIQVEEEVYYFGKRAAAQMQTARIVEVFQKELRALGYTGSYLPLSK